MPAAPGLRPTPDRVRETLFNWLQGSLSGARCLDLFAGSGALGFEAASRGAREVVFVERRPVVTRHLRQLSQALAEGTFRIVTGDALRVLRRGELGRFDIVFVDPPYGAGLLERVWPCLPSVIQAPGWVYVELGAEAALPELPLGWTVSRTTRAGAVRGFLISVPAVPMEGAAPGPALG